MRVRSPSLPPLRDKNRQSGVASLGHPVSLPSVRAKNRSQSRCRMTAAPRSSSILTVWKMSRSRASGFHCPGISSQARPFAGPDKIPPFVGRTRLHHAVARVRGDMNQAVPTQAELSRAVIRSEAMARQG